MLRFLISNSCSMHCTSRSYICTKQTQSYFISLSKKYKIEKIQKLDLKCESNYNLDHVDFNANDTGTLQMLIRIWSKLCITRTQTKSPWRPHNNNKNVQGSVPSNSTYCEELSVSGALSVGPYFYIFKYCLMLYFISSI